MESLGREKETYILVEYAFEYTAKDGRLVSIKPNERYVLLKRTNDHWWHVRKSRDSRPFYIPAKYVRQLPGPVAQTEPPSETLPPTTRLEDADSRAPVGVGREQRPEYEYRFVSAAPVCEPRKTDTDEPGDSSQAHFVSSQAGPLGVDKKVLPPLLGGKRATPAGLSASHGCLKPHGPTEPSCSGKGYNRPAEHIRPTVSLDDLARFTPHSPAGTGGSGLHKAASWGHPHPRLGSENFHGPAEEGAKQATQELATELGAEQLPSSPPEGVRKRHLSCTRLPVLRARRFVVVWEHFQFPFSREGQATTLFQVSLA
ncbi:UNVERIFIED_CONTAM: hypothetical protein K2H54_005817 [Gekko kuhli]